MFVELYNPKYRKSYGLDPLCIQRMETPNDPTADYNTIVILYGGERLYVAETGDEIKELVRQAIIERRTAYGK